LIYIETDSKDAAYHFSVEEYLTRVFRSDEPVLMIWQADKCVMLGNYQVAAAEVNMGTAQAEGIQIVRRSSGGGTIFTDLGTLLYTVIMPFNKDRDPLKIARETVAAMIVKALGKMGVPASQEGRNDILVDGKKVSGLAQYTRRDRLCTHGSLLYNTDLDMLVRALNVDEGKILSKAIRSVRSRVTNISQYMDNPPDTGGFQDLLKQKLFEDLDIREYVLNADELTEINRIYHDRYGNSSWTVENTPKFSFHNSERFPGGKAEVFLDISKGIIDSCSIRGDFLGTTPIRGLEEQLEKKAFEYDVILETLDRIALEPYLGSITKAQLLSCLF